MMKLIFDFHNFVNAPKNQATQAIASCEKYTMHSTFGK